MTASSESGKKFLRLGMRPYCGGDAGCSVMVAEGMQEEGRNAAREEERQRYGGWTGESRRLWRSIKKSLKLPRESSVSKVECLNPRGRRHCSTIPVACLSSSRPSLNCARALKLIPHVASLPRRICRRLLASNPQTARQKKRRTGLKKLSLIWRPSKAFHPLLTGVVHQGPLKLTTPVHSPKVVY